MKIKDTVVKLVKTLADRVTVNNVPIPQGILRVNIPPSTTLKVIISDRNATRILNSVTNDMDIAHQQLGEMQQCRDNPDYLHCINTTVAKSAELDVHLM